MMPYQFVDEPDASDPLQKKKDGHILEKLTSGPELSGILNLIIYRAKSIALDKTIHRIGDDFARYEEQSYSVSDFMDRFIEFNSLMRDYRDWQVSANLLFSRFEEYAKYTIGAKVSRKTFSRLIGKENGESSRSVRLGGESDTPQRGFRGLTFNEMEFQAFIEEKKAYYTTCNDCIDLVTISKGDRYDTSRLNVTNVTIFKSILKVFKCMSLLERASENMIVTEIVTESTDSGKLADGGCIDALQPKDEDILTRSLSIIERKKVPVNPFILAIHTEGLDHPIEPAICREWLTANGWNESPSGWKKE